MTQDYLAALSEIEANPELTEGVAARRHASNIRWDRELENNLRRGRSSEFDINYIRTTAYRPFVRTNCYADYTFANLQIPTGFNFSKQLQRKSSDLCSRYRWKKIVFYPYH